MVNRIALITALALSAIAAYFSVIGLATIFAGAFWAVIVMAGALESGKVVTVAWLSRNWDKCPKVIKYYLTAAAVILMLITSMGTFGYLSKAHLETNNQLQQAQLQIEPLETQLALAERKLRNAQTSLDTLDRIVAGVDIDKASRTRSRQRADRESLAVEIRNSAREVEMVNAKLLPLRAKKASTEAEIGPLKYIAELIYGANAADHFDDAVRFVIILLVLVFDPLAVVLLIAANYGMKPQNRFIFNKQTGKLEANY